MKRQTEETYFEGSRVQVQESERTKTQLIKVTLPIEGNRWHFHFFEIHSSLFFKENDFDPEVLETLRPWCLESQAKEDRTQIEIRGVPLMLAVFPQEKTIRFYSTKARYEAFLLQGPSSQYEAVREHLAPLLNQNNKNLPKVIERVTLFHQLSSWDQAEWKEWNNHSQENAKILLSKVKEYRFSLFEKISDFCLNLSASYALIRIHLLKFLAILPHLENDYKSAELKRVLLESFRRLLADSKKSSETHRKGQLRALPALYQQAFNLLSRLLSWVHSYPLGGLVRWSVRFFARRFIAGENIQEAGPILSFLKKTGRDATFDQLGELVVSEAEADLYLEKVLELIDGLYRYYTKGDKNQAGIYRAHVSIKVSALCCDFKGHSVEAIYKKVAPRLKTILIRAAEKKVFINIDAEHYHYRDLVLTIYRRVLLETTELHDYQQTGIVLQGYLRDAYSHLQEIIELAKERGHCLPIRLVKGAYWDAETIEAEVEGHLAPQFLNKVESDLHFRQLVVEILKNYPHVQLCLGSHNLSDHLFARSVRELSYPKTPEIEHQCLHMTYEALSQGMAELGWAVRNYVPIGSLLVGMAYLVRRIMENSSQVGILNQMRTQKKWQKLPLPEEVLKESTLWTRDSAELGPGMDYENIAPLRTYLRSSRDCFEKSETYQVKENPWTGTLHKVQNPSRPLENIGQLNFACLEEAKASIEKTHKAYAQGKWALAQPWERSVVLQRGAELMLVHRNALAKLIVEEAGKTIPEALGDVDEAIDFLRFYAHDAGRFHTDDSLSRGVFAVIAPWNFPLAIPCGMTAGALSVGNNVILKSAEQTPLIAQALTEIFYEAGVPRDCLIHLPGEGELIGRALVEDSRLAGYVFTGSKEVGLSIYQSVMGRLIENPHSKTSYPAKVIAEMGGKNAIIICATAELDETLEGVLYSAFGHAGQKCSACSRVFVHQSVRQKFLKRFSEACHDIAIGESDQWETVINPLIGSYEKEQFRLRVQKATQEAKQYGGQVIVDRSQESFPGHCVGPAMIELPNQRARVENSLAQQEMFAPLLALFTFSTNEEAAELFNSTPFALTGGVFSQSQDDLDFFAQHLEAGNLYFNRSCTGARVGIEPFGGFKKSGTGPKAGGKSYLSSFLVDRKDIAMAETTQEFGHDERPKSLSFSGLNIQSRRIRLDRALGRLIQNYENLFHQLRPKDRESIVNFRAWVEFHLVNYIEKKHPNRIIPGQDNFDSFEHCLKKGLLIAGNETPHIKTLLNLFSGLSLGAGILVMATSSESFRSWNLIADFFYQAGFSSNNLQVIWPTQKAYQEITADKELEFMILEGGQKFQEKIMTELPSVKERGHILKVFSHLDSPPEDKIKRYLKQFIKIRSFAINTMRHGAPMSLDLEQVESEL